MTFDPNAQAEPNQQPYGYPQSPQSYQQYPPQQHGSPYGYPPQHQGAPYGYLPQQSAGTNGMAIAGFVCAFLCSILGLIFSAVGLSQINRNPAQGGKGLAIAGLVISIISLVVGIAVFAGRS